MEGDSLYSVKWYKGRREFYRYTPKENPAMKTFAVNGINVEVSVSISMYEHWSTLINARNTIVMYSKIRLDECIFICFIWLHLYWPHVFLTIAFYYSFMLWSITWLLFSVYTRTTNNTQYNTRRVVNSFIFGSLHPDYLTETYAVTVMREAVLLRFMWG